MTVLDDFNAGSVLIISGHITGVKKQEFEQTYRLASSTISKECLFHNLTIDIEREGYYHFVSVWTNEQELKRFSGSVEYQLLNGAFHALGSIGKSFTCDVTGISFFSTNNNPPNSYNNKNII